MCGIAGVFAKELSTDVSVDLARLTAALSHRGPDGTGEHFLGNRAAALGHRRLSIVDLEGGAQPMSNEDGRVWLVFNGELYNHASLRAELEAAGHTFKTRSDTEVLIHGFEEWGPAVVERLNGIFAFALHDGRGSGRGTLWLGRDPLGVKPLFLGRSRDRWWLASELAAARAVGLCNTDLRPESLDEYLVYRFVPAPHTPFTNTWKLPASHLCRLDLAALPDEPRFDFYAPRFAPASTPTSAGEWSEALVACLRAGVQRQLMSDVPIGSLLSGGVDSAVVTAMMREALPSAPQAFAIGFSDAGRASELVAARRVATALGVPLHELAVREGAFVTDWPRLIASLGEPIANSGAPLVARLCELVRKTHKVVQSGQGADEPLGGYPRHSLERLVPLLSSARGVFDHVPEGLLSSDRVQRVRRVLAAQEEARRFAETLAVFAPALATELTGHGLDPDTLAEPVRRGLRHETHTDSFSRLLAVDTRLSLADDLLTVADHTSMAASVELRVPFLDLELVTLLERMPARYKVSRLGERKWLYRRAVRPILPASIRRELTGLGARIGRKQGFSTPLSRWYPTWLANEAEAYLTGPGARLVEVLRGDVLRRFVREARDGGLPRSRQMQALYVLETWLRGPTLAPAAARS